MVSTQSRSSFQYVRESDEQFLSLFPHRYDYIWAEHSQVREGHKLCWKTESRHPLSDRLILQGAALYGVRFGAETRYGLLDIDFDSLYHPRRDPFAISRMVAALESLGLVSFVACTSSYSGGIHLYFPFEQPVKTWQLAIALQFALENAGFCIAPGQLEIFPNPKLYVSSGLPSLYAAHRLPLQVGSYLLDADWQLTYTTHQHFVDQWRRVAARNEVSPNTIENWVKAARQRRYSLSGKADKFLNDLNADIEPGWTGPGQTNYLLGRIAIRSYVFGHILYGVPPLVGKPLVDNIVKVAQALPGYGQWCGHQHEIEHRAEEWARCVENSHYFQFQKRRKGATTTKTAADAEDLTWNQRQQQAVREKIRRAIANLVNHNQLPRTTTARFKALTAYGIGGASLYRHRDLWHPDELNQSVQDSVQDLKNLPAFEETDGYCVEDASPSVNPTSLLAGCGGNSLGEEAFSDFLRDPQPQGGCNHAQPICRDSKHVSEDISKGISKDANEDATQVTEPLTGIHHVQRALKAIAAYARQQQARRQDQAAQSMQARQRAQQAAYADRMRQYLESGDPILMREAIATLRARWSPLPRVDLASNSS